MDAGVNILNKLNDVNELVSRVNELKKKGEIDLSSGEDLSIALMNLISIEEHMYFSGMKTGKKKYFDMLGAIREMRKKYLKDIVKSPEGEEWCISKHLLAASMRLIEVGNKHLAKGEDKKSHGAFEDAFHLYSMFWTLNLHLAKNEEMITLQDAKTWKEKMSGLVAKIVDCCKE